MFSIVLFGFLDETVCLGGGYFLFQGGDWLGRCLCNGPCGSLAAYRIPGLGFLGCRKGLGFRV